MAILNSTTHEDYYTALGVPPDSSTKQIKLAYRRLAQKYDPAQGAPVSFANRFQAITEAYLTLSNPEQRATYDKVNGYLDWNSDAFSAVKEARGILKRFFHETHPAHNTTQNEAPSTKSENVEPITTLSEEKTSAANFELEEDPFAPLLPIEEKVDLKFEDPFLGSGEFLLPLENDLLLEEEGFTENIDNLIIPEDLPPGSILHIELQSSTEDTELQADLRNYKIGIHCDPLLAHDERDIIINLPLTYEESLNGAQLIIPTPKKNLSVFLPPAFPAGSYIKFIGMGFSNGEVGDLIVKPFVALPRTTSASDCEKTRLQVQKKREYLVNLLSS